MNNDKIIECFNFRYACKVFDSKRDIAENDFMTILESARLSPSSFGLEPWRFIILQNEDIKEKIFNDTWGGHEALKSASKFIIILARKNIDLQPNSQYVWHMMRNIHNISDDGCKLRSKYYENFHKYDFDMHNDAQKVFDWSCKQSYIALANMMTTATLLGIDSLPIEGFCQKNIDIILEQEGIIDSIHFGSSVMVAFGYRLKEPKRAKTRQKLKDIIQFI
ncbi:NAD(P)H-dependent oxidoreductase [Helicobacter muridarum]|uniref:NAD(P)H-dependent oxidoreductase n=1 Tax=Helicobacter muridarum TaxID=216 RepID=A0A4U8TKL9_9HELI|nr:NAD(P)H-dependent oxidoreductase [Helicobacter muridarum]